MLNAPLVGQRLGYPELSGLDLLELFAFVHPARFAVPTPKGLAHALGLAAPADDAESALFLRAAAERLLSRARSAMAGAGRGVDQRAVAGSPALALGWRGGRAPAPAGARRALAVLAPGGVGGVRAARPAPAGADRGGRGACQA
jgi:hypothetical protein